MRVLLRLFTSVIFFTAWAASAGTDAFDCSSTKDLRRIAAYVGCEAFPEYDSCAKLATRLTGKALTTASKSRERRDPRSRYAARFEVSLRGGFHGREHELADLAWDVIVRRVKEGDSLSSPTFKAHTLKAVRQEWANQKDDKLTEQQNELLAVAVNEVVASIGDMAQSELMDVVANTIENTDLALPVLLRAAGVGGAKLLGGTVASALFIAVSPTSTACDDTVDSYIHRAPKQEMGGFAAFCEPVYELDERTIRFIDDSRQRAKRDEVRKVLELPPVCDYYSKIHEKTTRRQKIRGLKCESGMDFTIETENTAGTKYRFQARSLGESYLKQINVFENGGGLGPFQFDVEGKPTYGVTEESRDLYRQMKLFITEARDCCASRPDDQKECLSYFNDQLGREP